MGRAAGHLSGQILEISGLFGAHEGTRIVSAEASSPNCSRMSLGMRWGSLHVADPTAIMASEVSTGRDTFNASEQYHARLAYEVGRGNAYCGWPFQASCTQRGSFRAMGTDPIVIN